jgi:hypothetical protein
MHTRYVRACERACKRVSVRARACMWMGALALNRKVTCLNFLGASCSRRAV